MRAPTWVYDTRVVSRPVLYTAPTAAQIPPNFPFRASARSPGGYSSVTLLTRFRG